MNEAEYLMKNYGDRGGCYPSRPQAEADNTLRECNFLAEPTSKPTTPKESDKPISATGPHSTSLARSKSTKDGSKAIVTTSTSNKL